VINQGLCFYGYLERERTREMSQDQKPNQKSKETKEDPSTDLVPRSESAVDVPSGALLRSDPLKAYLSEISKYEVLDPEVERELALKLRDDGDLESAKKLVRANLRLVAKIAFEYRTAYQNILDLIQEGNIGLMKAVSKYDPDKGARLSSYASWWIRSYILKFIIDNFRLVKIGTTQAQKKLFYNLLREKERLEALGEPFQPKLIAENLGVKESEVIEMDQRLSGAGNEVSLEAPIKGGDSESTSQRLDYLEDESPAVDEILAAEELREILENNLKDFRKGLSDREAVILKERLLSELPKTLQEIADRYQISRERARQIEAKILDKLRSHLKDQMDLDKS